MDEEKIEGVGGLLSQPPDSRDALYGAFEEIGVFPESFELPRLGGIRYQGTKPSCVYQSIARIQDYANNIECDTSQISARYGYAYCKLWDGIPELEGTFFTTGLSVAIKMGTALTAKWADDWTLPVAEYLAKPSLIADQSAEPFKIKGYIQLSSPDQVKDYITKFGLPVLMGINSNGTGWNQSVIQAHDWVLQEPTGALLGHAVVCVGWEPRGWIFENSWHESWGDKGRAIVPYNYSGLQNSFLGVYDLPNNWKELNEEYKNMVNAGNINGLLKSITGLDDNFIYARPAVAPLNSGNQAEVDRIMKPIRDKYLSGGSNESEEQFKQRAINAIQNL